MCLQPVHHDALRNIRNIAPENLKDCWTENLLLPMSLEDYYPWNICRLFLNAHFLLELVTSFPFIITIFFKEYRIMYVPVFLNCWLAKGSLHSMMLEALGQTWIARRKCGSDFSGGFSKNEKHVVVTITHLEMALVRDFLDEFYAHHENKDEHTILRSWAVKDFAPHVKQYVQIFRPETKMHLEHAEVLICEDEFKYALLANNCICPGISTFITLLMHTSKGDEGKNSSEPWHKVYGFHSGNELYMIKAEDSKFFGGFIGKSFTYASYCAHERYGVGLIGVKSDEPNAKTLLNPGVLYIIKATDVLYYMALTNEESLYNFHKDLKDQKKKADLASTIANVGEFHSQIRPVCLVTKYDARYILKARDQEALISGSLKMPSQPHPSMELLNEAKPGSSSESESEDYCEKCKGPCIRQKLDNLLRAGVSNAEHVVVVKEFASLAEEHLADCSTIITVQKIHR
ncbi:Calcium-activated BK potassium channel alpha subunit [Teladorsagia circumcincta]|uniref:Calcium-activated BK potassium channel alpha subunit n=1 Tax=Teladorsagia circumcincta TaxID=45464 RepID=A0A2G9URD5_TELCI|nr:Calcium-activated BK potassium channel alpha subunit [Teladorsagia circumcincta]